MDPARRTGRDVPAARTGRPPRPRLLAALALTLAGAVLPAPAAAADAAREEEVKAAFVVNFLRYTEWPAASFAGAESPFVVVVIGSDEVAASLAAIAERAAPIAGRRLTVERRPLPGRRSGRYDELLADLRRSHLLYLGAEVEEETAAELFADLDAAPVLTVGDRPGFAAAGGMIGLLRDGDRIVFEADPETIREARLQVSARVLRLARIVGGAEGVP